MAEQAEEQPLEVAGEKGQATAPPPLVLAPRKLNAYAAAFDTNTPEGALVSLGCCGWLTPAFVGGFEPSSLCIAFVCWGGFFVMIAFGAFFSHWARLDPRGTTIKRYVTAELAWNSTGVATWNAAVAPLLFSGGLPVNTSVFSPSLSLVGNSQALLNLTLQSSTAGTLDGVAPVYSTGAWAVTPVPSTLLSGVSAASGHQMYFSIPGLAAPPIAVSVFKCNAYEASKADHAATADPPNRPWGNPSTRVNLLTGHRRSLLKTTTSTSKSSHSSQPAKDYGRSIRQLSSVQILASVPAGCVAGACTPTLSLDPCGTSYTLVRDDYGYTSTQAPSCGDSLLSGVGVTRPVYVALRLSSDPVVIGERLTECRGNFGLTKHQLVVNAGCLLGFGVGMLLICWLCSCIKLAMGMERETFWIDGLGEVVPTGGVAPADSSECTFSFQSGPVQYIKLRRADGLSEHINIASMSVSDANGNEITEGVIATLDPQYDPDDTWTLDQFGPQVLLDGYRSEKRDGKYHLAHTDASPQAWIMLDLGSEKDVYSVTIWNRTECCQSRINGCVLEFCDSKNNLVYASPPIQGSQSTYTWYNEPAESNAAAEEPVIVSMDGRATHKSPEQIQCTKIFWHKHMLGLPSDTLAWPRMASLNGLPVEYRVCSVCLQGDNHVTHRGTHWRCTEGCNFDACVSCGAMEHVSIDNVANVAFSDTQHWLYKCFSRAPCIMALFSCTLSLVAFFCVLPFKLVCCIESGVCNYLFGERLDHDKAERDKTDAEEKLAAQREAAKNEQAAMTAPAVANPMVYVTQPAVAMVAAPTPSPPSTNPMVYTPKPAVLFYAPKIPIIVQQFVPQAYHSPYQGKGQPFQFKPVYIQQTP